MAKILFTENGIPLTVNDRIAIFMDKDKINAGTVISLYSDKVGVILDDNKTKLSVSVNTGRILAELNKKNKFPNGVKKLSEMKAAIKDYGGDIYREYKVPGIKTKIKNGDTIFIFNNRQAVAKEVYLIRAQVLSKGAIIVLRDNVGIQCLFKENFDKIIGIYNGKKGSVLNKVIPLKELKPYLKDYHRELTMKILGEDFIEPNLTEYANDFLNTIRNHYRSLKIKKEDITLVTANSNSFIIKFSKDIDIPKAKSIIYKMWKLYGNACSMKSNYEHMTVTVIKKPNTSDGELRRLIEYNKTHLV